MKNSHDPYDNSLDSAEINDGYADGYYPEPEKPCIYDEAILRENDKNPVTRVHWSISGDLKCHFCSTRCSLVVVKHGRMEQAWGCGIAGILYASEIEGAVVISRKDV